MKALIQKELREIAVWAGVGALIMLAVIALFIYQGVSFYLGMMSWNASAQNLFQQYRDWMKIGAAVVGLGVGLVQVIPELRRDQWAFLIHRPLTLRQIWLAKVIAGVAGYLIATLLPLLIVTAWFDQPGHFPGPFDLRLALPGLIYVLTGLTFYFAAQIVALRPARWWGSRLLPLVTAACCILIQMSAGSALPAALISVAFLIPLIIAAQGSFVTLGEYDGQSKAQRTSLGLVIALGAAAVVLIIATIGINAYQSVRGIRGIGGQTKPTEEEFALTKSGEIVILDEFRFGYSSVSMVRNLSGSPISGASLNASDYSVAQTLFGGYDPEDFTLYETYYRIVFYPGEGMMSPLYFSTRDRLIYVYTYQTAIFQGYMGSDGVVCDNKDAAPRFPQGFKSSSEAILVFPSAIYILKLGAYPNKVATVDFIASSSPGDPFQSVTTIYAPDTSYGVDSDKVLIAAQSKSNLTIFNHDGEVVASEPLKPISVAHVPYSTALLIWPNHIRIGIIHPGYNTEYDAGVDKPPFASASVTTTGNITNVTPTLNPQRSDNPTLTTVWPAIFAPIAPMGIVMGAVLGVASAHHDPSAFSRQNNLTEEYGSIWALSGGVLGLIAIIPIARRYGATGGKLVPWLICGFFLSWVGILMILAIRPFPVLIVCSSCGKKRGIETLNCEHCGHGIDSLAPDGREIFEESSPDMRHATLAS